MRIITLALGASIIAAGLVPASAAGAGRTIGNVTIAWTDDTHSAVRVRWTETTPTANSLQLLNSDGTVEFIAGPGVGDPDQVDIPRAVLGSTTRRDITSRIAVIGGAAEAYSAGFDRYVPGGPLTMAFLPGGAMSFDVPASRQPDRNPGDPLDVPGLDRYQPNRILPGPEDDWNGCDVVYGPVVRSLPYVLPYPATSYLMYMYTSNEWGGQAWFAEVLRSRVSMRAPAGAYYNSSLAITGTATADTFVHSGSPPHCALTATAAPLTAALQARRDASTPWAAVTPTGVLPRTGQIDVRTPAIGTRQYRLVVPNQLIPPTTAANASSAAMYGSASGPATPIVRTRILGARFLDPTIGSGQQATAFLAVSPAGSQRALLQYRTAAGQWRGLTYRTLSSGRGTATFRWPHRGTTAFRWYVPAGLSPARLPVAATFTPAFSLSVR